MNCQKYSNYKGDYYNSDICRFIGLHPSKLYYKSYIVQCLMNKLEFKYGRYQLNQDCIQIMNDNNIYMGWNHSFSRSQLNRIVSQLKLQKPDTSICIVLKIYEEGNNMEQLVI